MYKNVSFGKDSRDKIIKGVNITNRAVGSTLGPRGRNVIFEDTSYPVITKDGVTVAQQISLEDKLENMGVMIAREAAQNTNKEAGDGTTTTVVLLSSIINEAEQYIVAGMNPILIKRGMDDALKQAVLLLEGKAKQINTEKEKLQIATISANNDPVIGSLISEVIKKTGKNGIVSVTSGNSLETTVEYVKGMKIENGYESHMFINDSRRLTAFMEDPVIIVTSDKVTMQSQLIPLIEKLVKAGKNRMVLFAERIEGQALAFLLQNYMQGKFMCVPVKFPSFGAYKKDTLYDMAKLIQATVVGEDEAIKLENATIAHMGTCDSVTVGQHDTIVSGGKGNIKERIDEINALLDRGGELFQIEKLKERLGKLTGSIANIKVGGASDTEQTEKKYRIEDALNATKSAIDKGIVEGGGCTLLRISKELEDLVKSNKFKGNKEYMAGVDILIKAFKMPLKTIVENSGVSGDVVANEVIKSDKGYNALTEEYQDLFKAGIIDPLKVVESEINNSVATAGILITSGCSITNIVPKDK